MSTVSPTRRELFLVAFLFVALITLSTFKFDFSIHGTLSPISHQETNSIEHSDIDAKVRQTHRTRLSLESTKVPETRVVAHVPGWTIFDNMYILNGTVYLVTNEPDKFPNRSLMTSTADIIKSGAAEGVAARLPTDKDMQLVSTKEAKRLFGKSVNVIDGVTFYANDPHQFVTHYFHWSAELWFGFWRTYSTLDPKISADGNTTLPPPRRMMFPHLDADHWRDYASMNQWVLRSSFPSLSFEFIDDWRDRIAMGKPLILDRVVFADRSSAMMGYNYLRTQRTAAQPFALPGSAHWWMTIRSNVLKFTGLSGEVGQGTTNKPVITYVSRQEWGRRMLIKEDHEKLVEELYKLRDTYGYEVNVVSMDKLSVVEQLRLAARTTIMMGVHGNALTSLVWMKPTPRSTVIEFFFPGGFAHDYEFTTRALGMVHYGFWGSSYFTSPQVPEAAYPEGFQGNEIPLDGAVVAKLCLDRLTLSDEADD